VAHAHLNGSINLTGPEEVFRTVSSIAGETVRRIPDGETDARRDGLERQVPILAAAAVSSYEIFKWLRDDEQAMLPETRFQVSLPSVAGAQDELDRILTAIPHEDLALQWNAPADSAVADELAQLSSWVAADVPFGYHLCDGRRRDPGDMSQLVAVANAISESGGRAPAWFSFPVPPERDDDAFFQPLADLRLAAETHPYLGLVHEDGLDAIQRRIAAAKRYLNRFGVCAGCGVGEKPRGTVLKLLWLQLGARV
jgi:hypothetical protein